MIIYIDFEVIPTYNPKTLVVEDASDWLDADDMPAYISITPPGAKDAINHIFQKRKRNRFNSVNLNMSCLTECGEQTRLDLPDGIWTICLQSSYDGLNKKRYYLKTDRFRLELDKVYVRLNGVYDSEDEPIRKDLRKLEFLLRTAEAFTRDGDFYKASRDFSEAQKLLEKHKECKNCH